MSLFEEVTRFYETDDWKIEITEPGKLIRTGFSGKNGRFGCHTRVYEDRKQVVCYTVYPSNAPENRRIQTMEFITRANYGLILGNFEMDLSDGEIRYKSSIDVENDRLTPALLKHVIYSSCITADRYLPGLMAVMFGGKNPKDAVDAIENPPEPEPTPGALADEQTADERAADERTEDEPGQNREE